MTGKGACFCQEVEFEIEGLPISSTICHCSDCQRFSGAPMQASATFRAEQIKITKGKPKPFTYGEGRIRLFCETCGSQLFFSRLDSPDEIEAFLGVLERNWRMMPETHIWMEDRAPYINLDDQLPKYLKEVNGSQ
jgi:hypothetical protein